MHRRASIGFVFGAPGARWIRNHQSYALDIPDYKFDSVGARGVGEIGITGTVAAISNAISHATGRRVPDLPITPDKLI